MAGQRVVGSGRSGCRSDRVNELYKQAKKRKERLSRSQEINASTSAPPITRYPPIPNHNQILLLQLPCDKVASFQHPSYTAPYTKEVLRDDSPRSRQVCTCQLTSGIPVAALSATKPKAAIFQQPKESETTASFSSQARPETQRTS